MNKHVRMLSFMLVITAILTLIPSFEPIAASSSKLVLKFEDKSDAVKVLQQKLAEKDYLLSRHCTGYFGEFTQKAVQEFQGDKNLSRDGIAGNATLTALFGKNYLDDAFGEVYSPNTGRQDDGKTIVLRPGMTSDSVKVLQKKLIDKKYLDSRATGYYGDATEAAVKKYQEEKNLGNDGIAGDETLSNLFGAGYVSNEFKDTVTSSSGSASSDDSSSDEINANIVFRKGMRNDGVEILQQKLRDKGYLSASATGYYGDQTYDAVAKYQKDSKLRADGVAGHDTLRSLFGSNYAGNEFKGVDVTSGSSTSSSSAGSSIALDDIVLRTGMRSEEIKKLQKLLKNLGYFTVGVTGYFGAQTEEAVKNYQLAHDISNTGVVAEKTRAQLNSGTSKTYAEKKDYIEKRKDEIKKEQEELAKQKEESKNKANQLVEFAKKYLGKPYRYGASGTSSFDCSGFTKYVFGQYGFSLPHTSRLQVNYGTKISKSELKKGDLVFFDSNSSVSHPYGHVGIYIGNGEFIHASSSGGVKINNMNSGYYANCLSACRRLLK